MADSLPDQVAEMGISEQQEVQDPTRVCPCPRLSDWLPDACEYESPLVKSNIIFKAENEFVNQDLTSSHIPGGSRAHARDFDAFLRAGPRKKIFLHPSTVNACIVTTGGLCPGLNSVVEEMVRTLTNSYGVPTIYGIRFGFKGFCSDGTEPTILNPKNVRDIHLQGGTVLGTGRGGFDINQILKFIKDRAIRQVYVIGGDGSHRAALAIHDAVQEKKMLCVVMGVPKTIDNDISYFDKTFGFDTAVEVASRVIECAYTEARSVENGIGLVKVMGRDSGFVARNAALSSNVVDACLIPEMDFPLEGEKGFLTWLERTLKAQHRAVIVMSESAGQSHIPSTGKDATGHNIYEDCGKWMKGVINDYLKEHGMHGKVFYIDPSYMIRSVPANRGDNQLCIQLAQAAVHAAFSGFSGSTVGQYHGLFAIMPINLVVAKTRNVNLKGSLWQTVLSRISYPSG